MSIATKRKSKPAPEPAPIKSPMPKTKAAIANAFLGPANRATRKLLNDSAMCGIDPITHEGEIALTAAGREKLREISAVFKAELIERDRGGRRFSIGQRLTHLFESRGFNGREVAERLGLERQQVYRIMNGRTADPRFSTIQKLVEATGATLGEFFADEGKS